MPNRRAVPLATFTALLMSAALACGGGSSNEVVSEDDLSATANEFLVTFFDVLAGEQNQALIDLYAPECQQAVGKLLRRNLGDISGLPGAEFAAVFSQIQASAPELGNVSVEGADVGALKVNELADGYRVTPADPMALRFKVDGQFISANELLSSIGASMPSMSSEPLTIVQRDGKLYVGDCEDSTGGI